MGKQRNSRNRNNCKFSSSIINLPIRSSNNKLAQVIKEAHKTFATIPNNPPKGKQCNSMIRTRIVFVHSTLREQSAQNRRCLHYRAGSTARLRPPIIAAASSGRWSRRRSSDQTDLRGTRPGHCTLLGRARWLLADRGAFAWLPDNRGLPAFDVMNSESAISGASLLPFSLSRERKRPRGGGGGRRGKSAGEG